MNHGLWGMVVVTDVSWRPRTLTGREAAPGGNPLHLLFNFAENLRLH